jgi:glycosyltransferase involved in cell wall biosynthesis
MNKVIISIIVPIYNAEKYLPACIDSILNQTFINFELLLINDASKDNSLKISNQYAEKDNRIRVFNQEKNGGECVSRNVGLDNAIGKYIVCIDADDIVLENHLQSLYYSSKISSGTLVHAPHLTSTNGIISGMNEEKLPYFISNLFVKEKKTDFLFAGPAWSKMMETEIIRNNNIRFRTGVKINGDHIFHLEYLMFINAYKNVGEKTLVYFNRPESISKKHFSFEECFERVNLMIPMTKSVLERFNIEDKQIQNHLYSTPINAIISSIYALYRSPFRKSKKDRIFFLNEVLTDYGSHLNDYWIPQNLINKLIKGILNTKKLYFIDFYISIIITFRYTLVSKIKK